VEVPLLSLRSKLKKLLEISECCVRQPQLSLRLASQLPELLHHDPELSLSVLSQLSKVCRGVNYSEHWNHTAPLLTEPGKTADDSNPLRAIFDSRETGRGIWKWIHYFHIYHRHFSKFVGRDLNVLEIGVYSGGSLEMWRHYFGSRCRVYGVDLEEACKCYDNEYTEIIVGDQEDPDFWKAFKEHVPGIDVLIDDGGHKAEQQIVTLEEMLPHLRPGGVYLCEDVHGEHNGFSAFMQGIVGNMNMFRAFDAERPAEGVRSTAFQAWIRSIHFYPYVTVIEKADRPEWRLVAPKHGSEWQPFL
jgi:23S rRNA U2552 (ribose-2'-O)-methylase RlmE/FtsJ